MTKSRGINKPKIKYTPEQVAAITERYPHEATSKIAADLGLTIEQIYRKASNLGLAKTQEYLNSPDACRLRRGDNVGAEYRFQKGQHSWNKGKSYQPGGRCKETQFKKGEMRGAAQHNYVPIGSLRITKDGYLERKVTDDPALAPTRRWVAVHRLLWIEANGPVPDGHMVIFKQGMKTTNLEEVTLDKLELISRVENMKRNTYHNYPKEIATLIQLKGALTRQINKKEKRNE